MNTLNQEEHEILAAFEADGLQRATDAEQIQQHQAYAAAMLKKDARINIRLPSKDLRSLQKRALA